MAKSDVVRVAELEERRARREAYLRFAVDMARHPVVEVIGMALFLGWATDVTNFPRQGKAMMSSDLANAIGATAGAAIIAQQLAPSMPFIMDSANKLIGPAVSAGALGLALPK